MKVIKLSIPKSSSARISLPIDSIRLFGWEKGEKLIVTTNSKDRTLKIQSEKDFINKQEKKGK